MRVLSRVALVAIVSVLLFSLPIFADHLQGDCPLTLVASNPPANEVDLSPHGVFRSNGSVHVLRGQTLTTYTVTDLGDMQVAREDFIGSMAGRESIGGVTFGNGFLYISSEAGLEIFNLTNVRAGGSPPAFASRTANRHYRQMAVNGNILAGLFPSTDLPCYPDGTSFCRNTIEILNVTNPAAPNVVSTITVPFSIRGFNDIKFNQGFLYATGEGGTIAYNLANATAPVQLFNVSAIPGKFLVSNGTSLLGVGNDQSVDLYNVALNGTLTRITTFNMSQQTIDRANPIMFHRQAWIDDQAGRLITMIDERDPQTLQPARTIAFDVFDFTVPMWEGAYQRGYEDISYVTPDEVKYSPVAIGPLVYTIGEMSGLQTWGSCGIASGRIEWDNLASVFCGSTEVRGWVTGREKIANVEVFLDSSSLGPATISGPFRTDIPSRTPVNTFRIAVTLDNVGRGDHVIRAVATDALGNRTQFASQRVFFPGGGVNCRRRSVAR